MIKRTILSAVISFICCFARADITLDYCIDKAIENYPMIRKYDLIAKTENISLAEINKQWLPAIGVNAQATIQNAVANFPSALNEMMEKMGTDVSGLDRFQYKAGLDVGQIIWDGGASSAHKEQARAASTESIAENTVKLYAIKEKVISLFFNSLLISRQIETQRLSIDLLKANHKKIQAMINGGVAMQADADNLKAEILSAEQNLIRSETYSEALLKMLEIYVNENLTGQKFIIPEADIPADTVSRRPELDLFAAKVNRNQALMSEIRSREKPEIKVFLQSFYGYPGFNNFESMIRRKPSFNIIGGIRISWNISSFYTRNTSLRKIAVANENIELEKDVFLYNSRLLSQQQLTDIKGLREMIKNDDEIIRLRSSVRKAAEAQLENGVVDIVALLNKITDEKFALLNSSYHQIELLQTIYKLKYTLNQ